MEGEDEEAPDGEARPETALSTEYPSDGDAVICKIREHEESIQAPDGKFESRNVNGSVEIINPSEIDRIWGVSLHLDQIDATTLKENTIKLREIQPISTHRTEYDAEHGPLLSIKEVLDTEPTRDEVPSLSLPYTIEPHAIKLTIEIENLGSEPLSDIDITREIPPQWEFKPGLDYSIMDDMLIWRIPRLEINQIMTLELEPTISISSTEAVESGEIVAKYQSPGLISGLVPNSLRASTRHISYVTATEGERPGEWECVCAFENASSFSLTLEAASMEVVGKEEPLFTITGIKEILKPNHTWNSQPVPYSSNDRPRFTQRIQSSVVPNLDIASSGSVVLRPKSLPIVDARVEKGYDRSRIRSYTEDVVHTNISIENVGTSTINLIRVVDDLPHIFDKISMESLSVSINSRAIEHENMRLDLVDGRNLTLEEVTGDGHTIQLLIGTRSPISLRPGEVLNLRYSADASDPSATLNPIGSPCRVDLSSERHGPVITRECVKIPAIGVITQRREFKTGKSIFPGPEAGQHEIRLIFRNTSDTPLEDVVILDSLSSNFEMVSSDVSSSIGRELTFEHTSASEEGSEIHRWSVGRVERSETIEVTAMIESEDPTSDPEDSGSLGAEFGEEAEVEPNLPKWFGEDGEWIYGVQEDMVAPVPICAICGGDIPKGALICRSCAESQPLVSGDEEE